MIDLNNIENVDSHFIDFMHKLNVLKSEEFRIPLKKLSNRYWYESLRQGAGLELPSQLQQRFEPDAISRNEKGTIVHTTNKWPGYRRGMHRPQKELLDKVEKLAPGSSRALDHPLWSALDLTNLEVLNGHDFLRQLTPDVQSIVLQTGDELIAAEKILPLFRGRLNKLLRKPTLDALACLIWFLRKAHANEADQEQLAIIAYTLHDALILLGLDLLSLNIAFPLLTRIIDDILPLALPAHIKYGMDAEDYLASAFLLTAVADKTIAKYKRSITWKSRNSFMIELLTGKRGLDIRFAMLPRLLLDYSKGSIHVTLVKKFDMEERLRREAWVSLLTGLSN